MFTVWTKTPRGPRLTIHFGECLTQEALTRDWSENYSPRLVRNYKQRWRWDQQRVTIQIVQASGKIRAKRKRIIKKNPLILQLKKSSLGKSWMRMRSGLRFKILLCMLIVCLIGSLFHESDKAQKNPPACFWKKKLTRMDDVRNVFFVTVLSTCIWLTSSWQFLARLFANERKDRKTNTLYHWYHGFIELAVHTKVVPNIRRGKT